MKEFYLNYYPKFSCIAGDCKHTCCAGWEIQIDEKSIDRYNSINSDFSKRLKEGIDYKKLQFKRDKNKRCAFLNSNGLCDLITNLGEESLCQVCRDHPRFRSFFSDRTEVGLGFCCEQATRIILSFKDKIQPILNAQGQGEFELTFIEKSLLQFREGVLSVIQDRSLSIQEILDKLLQEHNLELDENHFDKAVKRFLSFERLDKSWTEKLKQIRKSKTPFNFLEKHHQIFENFLANEVYRHISNAEDVSEAQIILVGILLSAKIVSAMINYKEQEDSVTFEDIVEIIRQYSSEVEYSEKNLKKLFKFSSKVLK